MPPDGGSAASYDDGVPETDPYADDPLFDSTVAHPARVYDYWLGRKIQVVHGIL